MFDLHTYISQESILINFINELNHALLSIFNLARLAVLLKEFLARNTGPGMRTSDSATDMHRDVAVWYNEINDPELI